MKSSFRPLVFALAVLLMLPAAAPGQLRPPDDEDIGPASRKAPRQATDAPRTQPEPRKAASSKTTVADSEVTSLLFFEGPKAGLVKEQRAYRKSFEASRARYIFYEINLKAPAPVPGYKRFEIQAVCTGSNGKEIFRLEQQCWQEAGWKTSHHTIGWGRENPGAWEPGDYVVKLYYEGREVASGSFRIT